MSRNTSLTTVDQFLSLIEALPLTLVERGVGLAVMPSSSVTDSEQRDHLFHALELHAGKRGLRVRRGVVVWRVNGFAKS